MKVSATLPRVRPSLFQWLLLLELAALAAVIALAVAVH